MSNRQINRWFKTVISKPTDAVLYLVLLLAVLKLADLYSDINDHEDHWKVFKQEHHCEQTKSAEGNLQASWLCDDGKTYYRWRQVVR